MLEPILHENIWIYMGKQAKYAWSVFLRPSTLVIYIFFNLAREQKSVATF
jgi:hypothetical protein